MMQNSIDLFTKIENAAHEGAFGHNPRPTPTDAQCQAGNYKVGKVQAFGLNLAIEQPRHSYRTGIDPKTGKRWTSRLAAHYGYIQETKGNDGDPVDCFIGAFPQSEYAYVVNQYVNGQWDEHKVMLGFADESSARQAYLDSYDRGWNGLHSLVQCSISQLKWWLKNCNLKKPLKPDYLPYEGIETMNLNRITWDSAAQPENITLDQLLYEIRRADGSNTLLLDSVTMADIMEEADEILTFDALVSPYAKLERKMQIMKTVMERAGGEIKPLAMQISDPFKQNGVAQVAAIFELSDGQTVTIYFHNPDVNPKKIVATDEMISWKWLLNKKDITILVAPERGEDLNVREVATRIVKLAAKNSAAFQRANAKRSEKMQVIQGLKDEIVVLEKELTDVQHELEVAKVEAEDRAAKKQSIDWGNARELGSDAEIQALGVANIDEIGSENVYVEKDGTPYYFKPGNTEKWQVGSHDFSSDVVYGDGTTETEKSWIDSLSSGDTVYIYWLATDKDEPVNFRGKDGDNAVIVKDGYQMQVPLSDLKKEPDTNEQENQQTEVTQETETAGTEIDLTTATLAEIIAKREEEVAAIEADYKQTQDQLSREMADIDSKVNPVRNKKAKRDQINERATEARLAKEAKVRDVLNFYDPYIKNNPEEKADKARIGLENIVAGVFDNMDLGELLDKIDKFATVLSDASKAEEFDALIGAAAEKWAELDQKANG